jgi:hypothetical protein
MITGNKQWGRDLVEDISQRPVWLAAVVAVLAAGAVYLLVR